MSSISKCDDNLCIDKPKSFYDKIYSITGLFRKRPQEIRYPQRPLFRSEFGSITWTLFHRICAYYPTTPSNEEKKLINIIKEDKIYQQVKVKLDDEYDVKLHNPVIIHFIVLIFPLRVVINKIYILSNIKKSSVIS